MHPRMIQKKMFMGNMRRRPKFLWKKMRHRQALSNEMRRRPDFVD